MLFSHEPISFHSRTHHESEGTYTDEMIAVVVDLAVVPRLCVGKTGEEERDGDERPHCRKYDRQSKRWTGARGAVLVVDGRVDTGTR